MTDDPLIGYQLANYRIERLIGRGGMAQVYYGVDVKLQRPVAIKVIDARYRADATYAERFVREAQAVAKWRHENIIQVYYADDQDGLYYFAMEYIDGLDLGELLSQYASQDELMPYDHVLLIGRAVASALDYAHQNGVVHRDVKPSNVLIADDDRVILTDFGLALDVEQGTMGQVFGSAHYVAPEQARHSAGAVPQSDLYSLGVLLYEMLTGAVPFDDPSPTTLALQHITLSPPRPREINPDLSAEVEAILLKALSKSPVERYQSGGQLMDALEGAIQAGQPAAVERTELAPSPAVPPPSANSASDLATDDLLGRQVDEYRLEALLGRGGMARVYCALDVRLKRWVAIKVIDTPSRSDADYVMRFEREAQAVAQLEHPHIVRLYRYGEADGLLYMAMQYIAGASLESVLTSFCEDQEFIEPEDASRIVREVCLALDYAHGRGVIHRDVKPSNIMLDRQGQAFLTDFGLALLSEVGTRGEIFGSPHYVAPEQAMSSAQAVPQSDLYAVGIILYEMFTNMVPFDADEPSDVAMLQMTEPPRLPRELRPEISPELEAVILKTLAKEPQDRYASGAALADALERALSTMPPVGQPPPSATATHLSIPDRVTIHAADHPLPPIPAAVARPILQRKQRMTAPAPASPGAAAAPPTKRSVIYVGLGAGLVGIILLSLLAVVLMLTRGSTTAGTQTVTESPTPATETSVAPTPQPTTAIATATLLPPPTGTPRSTEMPVVTATTEPLATVTESQTYYDLLIAKRGEESLFIVNQTGETFPLGSLRLSNDKGAISGQDWGVATLATGACVAAWRDERDPKPPAGLSCSPIGARLTRSKQDLFWKEEFYVYYAEQLVGICEKDQKECVVSIPTQASYLLVVAKRAEEGLFVINWSAEALPLAPLRLGDGEGAVGGTDWGVTALEWNACVNIWKDKGEPKLPDGVTCSQVGQNLTRSGKDKQFWQSLFDIYYDGEVVGACEKTQKKCALNIPKD